MTTNGVLQLRVIIEADDFEQVLAFYRDTLGLDEQLAFEGEGDARVAILEAGRATLEIANPAQKDMIDRLETGARQGPGIRLAFEVSDGRTVTARLAAAGATVVGEPRETPWRSLNSRLEAPEGQQITIFEELEGSEERAQREGFGTSETR
ncbi:MULTISPECIES: VOC family protein [unclassified Diaminobutyricimonas]|uniref:VOC family protein n=1 Tax=unclassified Diaminobutyricimonas TaxID=2643261 RepID=UPI0012F4D984|nr:MULTISPECIES: VOC family protein [unclassified Diaminobutyricimonas]